MYTSTNQRAVSKIVKSTEVKCMLSVADHEALCFMEQYVNRVLEWLTRINVGADSNNTEGWYLKSVEWEINDTAWSFAADNTLHPVKHSVSLSYGFSTKGNVATVKHKNRRRLFLGRVNQTTETKQTEDRKFRTLNTQSHWYSVAQELAAPTKTSLTAWVLV